MIEFEQILRKIVERSSDPFDGSAPGVRFCKVPEELIRQADELLKPGSLTEIQRRTDLDKATARKVQQARPSVFLVVSEYNEVIHSAWSSYERAQAQIAKMDRPRYWSVEEMELDPRE